MILIFPENDKMLGQLFDKNHEQDNNRDPKAKEKCIQDVLH